MQKKKEFAGDTSPFIGVTGEDPVEKDVKALKHAKMLGQAIAKILKEKLNSAQC